MRDPRMAHLTDVEVLTELWRRRVEYMWNHWNAEYAPSEKVDIEYLDEQIEKDEAHGLFKAPKG